MIPERRAEQAQLPLPFQPSLMASLTQEERDQVRRVLAQLLLLAAGHVQEEIGDER